jgi:Bacterial regulatory proteins, luxR family.
MDRDEAVARLWDELADHEAAQSAGACRHLMAALCGMTGAWNAGWVASVRTADDPADPLRGWRIGAVEYLHHEPLNAAAVAEMKARWARREVDPLSLHSLRGAGETFRAFTLRRAMAPDWFQAPYYTLLYEGRRVHDVITVVFPLNRDAESAFVLHAGPERGPFTPEETALAARALRGLKWFHRRLMLGHGLLVASAPLTPAERRVLAELLTEATEKDIAQRLGLTFPTTHQYVVGLYRKFGVKGRAGLMSLWLNRAG